MVADVGKPDIETKIAILEKKANERGCPFGQRNAFIYCRTRSKQYKGVGGGAEQGYCLTPV